MPSWRETTPQLVQDDLDAVLSAALDAAQNLLNKNGEFFPFGVTVSETGEVGLAAADGLGEQPASTVVLDNLYAGVSGNRDAYRAAGFVADVKADRSDAVRVEAEHRDGGPALVVLMPYQRKGMVKKVVQYGQMSAGAGERRIWTER
ncbi:MAG: hypothetical protein QOG53_2479 [Frankiales bacterium]|jgi:hypothetical protein|nr:hypothetical protein [Frankiales bacterium]